MSETAADINDVIHFALAERPWASLNGGLKWNFYSHACFE
jgi:hypothetical protein